MKTFRLSYAVGAVSVCILGSGNAASGAPREGARASSAITREAERQVARAAAEVPAVEPEDSCGGAGPEPSLAYPLPSYTAGQLTALMTPSVTLVHLLSNLKLVFDRNLLAQPAFFDDAVLRRVFNAAEVRWVEPGTGDVAFDHAIKPTRVARIVFRGGTFEDLKVDVGVSHRCVNRHADRNNPRSSVAPHTYNSGYIRIRLKTSAGLTLGTVRRIFGPNRGEFAASCREPLLLSYDAPDETGANAFLLNSASFLARPGAHSRPCQSILRQPLPDDYLVIDVNIRVLERDFTQWDPEVSSP